MSGANEAMEALILKRIQQLHEMAPESIGDKLRFQLLSCDEETGTYRFVCHTEAWMRNPMGILHGGMCATILDQAMGYIAYCVKPGPGDVPTINLQVGYHRPLIPGKDALVTVKKVSVTRTLITLRAEATLADRPERVCMTATGTFFYKPAAT